MEFWQFSEIFGKRQKKLKFDLWIKIKPCYPRDYGTSLCIYIAWSHSLGQSSRECLVKTGILSQPTTECLVCPPSDVKLGKIFSQPTSSAVLNFHFSLINFLIRTFNFSSHPTPQNCFDHFYFQKQTHQQLIYYETIISDDTIIFKVITNLQSVRGLHKLFIIFSQMSTDLKTLRHNKNNKQHKNNNHHKYNNHHKINCCHSHHHNICSWS